MKAETEEPCPSREGEGGTGMQETGGWARRQADMVMIDMQDTGSVPECAIPAGRIGIGPSPGIARLESMHVFGSWLLSVSVRPSPSPSLPWNAVVPAVA